MLGDLSEENLGVWRKTVLFYSFILPKAQLLAVHHGASYFSVLWFPDLWSKASNSSCRRRLWGPNVIMLANTIPVSKYTRKAAAISIRASCHWKGSSRDEPQSVSPRGWWCARRLGKITSKSPLNSNLLWVFDIKNT